MTIFSKINKICCTIIRQVRVVVLENMQLYICQPPIVWRIKVENAKLILWSCFFRRKADQWFDGFFIPELNIKFDQGWHGLKYFLLFLNLGIRGGGGDSTLVVLVTGHLDETYNKNKMHEWIKKGKDKNKINQLIVFDRRNFR